MIKYELTPRQRAAQKLSQKTCDRITRPFLVPLLLALVFGFVSRGTRFDVFGQMSINIQILISFFLLAGVVIVVVFAGNKATDAVRHAGLSDETTEIIRRTATTFEGENLSFQSPNIWWSQLSFVLLLVAVAALMGWFGFGFATGIAEKILAVLGCAFFCVFALLTIVTLHQPNLRLGERGVFGYYRNFWPRLVSWDEIASAHFHQANNFHDGIELRTITLKNADDKTLLKLTSVAFTDAPPGFEARFVAELKRRLTGETET